MTVFVILNVLAYRQAWAMTHFVLGAEKRVAVEKLSRLQKAWILVWGVTQSRPVNRRTPAEVGLDFETLRFQSTDGIELEAWRLPVKQPRFLVCLFHGYATSKASMLAQAREFHELGAEVWLTDFRGSGGSTGNFTTVGWQEAEDVRAVFEKSRRRAPGLKVILYGASMGAAASLRAVSGLGCEPDAVILECPYNRLLDTAANRFHAMGLPAFPAAEALTFWGGAQHGFNAFALNPEEFARGVSCPTLLLAGQHDWRATVEQAQRIADRLGGPKQFKVFAQAGHGVYTEATAAEWRESVVGFLESHSLAQP